MVALPNPPDFDDLRRHAERQLKERRTGGSFPDADARKLLHELQVHQIELEMQNEELRRARVESQAALARYAELYDFAPVGYFSLDRDGSVRQLNLAGARLLGGERGNLVGQRFGRFVDPKDRPAFEAFLAHVFAGQPKEICEVALLDPDNPRPPSFIHIEAALDESRQTFSAVVMDITAKTLANAALRRSQQDLELAVRGAAMGIWNWNMRSGEMAWSDRFRQLFGIPADAPMSYERFLAALHPDDRERIGAAVRQALKSREEYSVECHIRRPDGKLRWIAAVGRGFYDERSGEVVGMSGIALDITERKVISGKSWRQFMSK